MDLMDMKVLTEWHVAINKFNSKPGPDFLVWMYDAKRLSHEIPRMALWFGRERLGEMPKLHQQCSHQEAEPITDNHLSCCLGVKCKECPMLLALETAQVTPEQLDELKAWTCAAHILHEKATRMIDDSEGYILTVGDRMFWQNIYESMAWGNAQVNGLAEPEDDEEPDGKKVE